MNNCKNVFHKKPCSEKKRCKVCGKSTCSPNYAYHVCAAVALGSIKTEKKARAVRENGKKGGRPRITKQLKTKH